MKEIRYIYSYGVNLGTEEEPRVKTVTHRKAITCADERFEAAYALAQSEADGEITVEDLPDPAAEPTQLDRIEAQITYTALMTDTLIEE